MTFKNYVRSLQSDSEFVFRSFGSKKRKRADGLEIENYSGELIARVGRHDFALDETHQFLLEMSRVGGPTNFRSVLGNLQKSQHFSQMFENYYP